jgi:transcriptional regulator with XRE-family HTH domain
MSIKKSEKNGFLSGEFGRRLRSVRQKLGLSVGSVCVLLGVSRDSYYKYEGGERFPKYQIILSIMDNLNVSFDYLMTGEGDMFLDRDLKLGDGCGEKRGAEAVSRDFAFQVSEMLCCMRLSNCVRLAVLKFFQEYRYEKADLIESEIRESQRRG